MNFFDRFYELFMNFLTKVDLFQMILARILYEDLTFIGRFSDRVMTFIDGRGIDLPDHVS